MAGEVKVLQAGVAYHGNRMLAHVREDMIDIASHGFDTVVHMFSHNDWDRHKNIMGEIFKITKDSGLDVWVDNWGLGGPPGDKSHFLSYHPEAHQVFSNGDMDPIRVCYNAPSFVQFTKDWIDTIGEQGAEKIFWDEPHLVNQKDADGNIEKWTCYCPTCRKLFEEKYGKPMPNELTPEVEEFRNWSVANYFKTATEYAKSHGMYNSICVMLGAYGGVSLDNLDGLCGIETLDNIGSDPYWLGHGYKGYEQVYEHVYKNSKLNLDVCEHYHKDHNIWIQAYHTPWGEEDDIIAAADAIYDAGGRNIFAWGYRGSDANDYRSVNPERTWYKMGVAMQRLRERNCDELRAATRKKLGLE